MNGLSCFFGDAFSGFTTADMVPSTKIKDEMLAATSTAAAAAAAAAANADPPAYTPKSLKYTHTV
jgi:hypothetical protein